MTLFYGKMLTQKGVVPISDSICAGGRCPSHAGINRNRKGGIPMDSDYLKQKRILLVDDEQELLN